MKNIIACLLTLSMVAACGGGSSSSGSNTGATTTGSNDNIDGTYLGTINFTVSALGLSQSESEPITFTIDNNALTYQGDDSNERFSVPVDGQGNFNGSFNFSEDGCSATFRLNGTVNAPNITGSVDGDGECRVSGDDVSVSVEGDFSATRQ